MNYFLAVNDRQLGTCLRMLFAEKLQPAVQTVLNEKGKIEFHISIAADQECPVLFEGKTVHGLLLSKNLRKIFRISDGKNLSATNVDAPIIRNVRKRFVKPGNTTNRKINRLCKS